MIANITRGESFVGVILYNENKVSKGEAEKIYTHNMLSDDKKDLIMSLELTAANYKGKISKPTFHVSISLAHSDKTTPKMLEEIGRKYMDAMGFANSPYVVYRHFDREHDHIHVVSSRIDLAGNRISDSNDRFISQSITRALEQEYGLQMVSSVKDETQEPYLADISAIAVNSGAVKDQIRRVVDFVLLNIKPVSFEGFQDELKARNVEVREQRHDKNYNKLKKRGLVYHLRGEDETRQTKGISGSAFSGRFSSTRINEQIEANVKARLSVVKERFAAVINTISTAAEMPYHSFKAQLQLIGFEPVFSRNSAGIYGMSFKESDTGAVFKASDIHEELFWHTLKLKLPGEDFRALNLGAEPIAPDVPARAEGTEATVDNQKDLAVQYKKGITVAIGELSRRGAYTKQEFAEGLAKAGVAPVYSTNSGGIYGLSFEILSTGEQFKASTLGKGYSWNDLLRNIFDDNNTGALTRHIQNAFASWKGDSEGRSRTQNDFLIHLNRFGLTLANTEEGLTVGRLVPQDDQAYQIENNIKLSDLTPGDIYAFFNLTKGSLSGDVKRDYEAKGHAADPLTQQERKLIEGWREGNRDTILEAYRFRSNVVLTADERTVRSLLIAEKSVNLGFRLNRYLSQSLLKTPDNAAIYSHPFNLVRYMNRRGVGITLEKDRTGRVVDIRFVRDKTAFMRLSELSVRASEKASFAELQRNLISHFNSKSEQTIELRSHLEQHQGFLFAHDRQLERFFEAMDNRDKGVFKTLISEKLDYKNLTTSDDPERQQILDFIHFADPTRFRELPDEYEYEPLAHLFSADENPMNREGEPRKKRRKRPGF